MVVGTSLIVMPHMETSFIYIILTVSKHTLWLLIINLKIEKTFDLCKTLGRAILLLMIPDVYMVKDCELGSYHNNMRI